MRDRAALKAAIDQGVAEFGRPDIVSTSAGVSPPGGPLEARSEAEWNEVIGINLTGVFDTLAVTVPHVVAAGNGRAIIVTSFGAGLELVQKFAAYNASNAGVGALAVTLANEIAVKQIRVNVLASGTVNTPLVTENSDTFKLFRPDLDAPTIEDARPVFEMIMGHPWVEPSDVSNALLFLASDEGRYIPGRVLAVDQGMTDRAM